MWQVLLKLGANKDAPGFNQGGAISPHQLLYNNVDSQYRCLTITPSQVLLKLGANKDARGFNQGATASYLSSLLGHRDCLRCAPFPDLSQIWLGIEAISCCRVYCCC